MKILTAKNSAKSEPTIPKTIGRESTKTSTTASRKLVTISVELPAVNCALAYPAYAKLTKAESPVPNHSNNFRI